MSGYEQIDTTGATPVEPRRTVVRTRQERRDIYLDLLMSLSEIKDDALIRWPVIGARMLILGSALFVICAAVAAEFPG